MQRQLQPRRVAKAVLLCFAGLASLNIISITAQAQDSRTLPLLEASRLVNTEYIPNAVQALDRRGHSDSAALWERATAGQPLFQYQLAGSGTPGYEFIPRHIVVPVEHDGGLVGLVGIDPYTGEFCWRLAHVSPAAGLSIQTGSSTTSYRSGAVWQIQHTVPASGYQTDPCQRTGLLVYSWQQCRHPGRPVRTSWPGIGPRTGQARIAGWTGRFCHRIRPLAFQPGATLAAPARRRYDGANQQPGGWDQHRQLYG